jgi:hypothetical protein
LNFRWDERLPAHRIACGNSAHGSYPAHPPDERMGRVVFRPRPHPHGTASWTGPGSPWAMDRPCIVCQENCPVSPRPSSPQVFSTVRTSAPDGQKADRRRGAGRRHADAGCLAPATTTCSCRMAWLESPPTRPEHCRLNTLGRAPDIPPPGSRCRSGPLNSSTWTRSHRLRRREHECSVLGLRAIRVTAENESLAAPLDGALK